MMNSAENDSNMISDEEVFLARAIEYVRKTGGTVAAGGLGTAFTTSEREELKRRHGGFVSFFEKSSLFEILRHAGGNKYVQLRGAADSASLPGDPGDRTHEVVVSVASIIYDLQEKGGGPTHEVRTSHIGGALSQIPAESRQVIKERFGTLTKLLGDTNLFITTKDSSGDPLIKLTQSGRVIVERLRGIESGAQDERNTSSSTSTSAMPSSGSASRFDDNITIVATQEDGVRAFDLIRTQELVVVDCEGVNLGSRGGALCLVQIAIEVLQNENRSEHAFLFDVQSCPPLLGGLKEVMESTDVLKCFHDIRADAAALARHDIGLSACIDSQVAYSLLEGHPQISLKKLLDRFGATNHTFKSDPPHKRDSAYWSKRPLSADGISYAASDVLLLLRAWSAIIKEFESYEVLDELVRISDSRVRNAQSRSSIDELRMDSSMAITYISERYQQTSESVIPCCARARTEIEDLLQVLPTRFSEVLKQYVPGFENSLIDIVMDCERPVRFIRSGGSSVDVNECLVNFDDLQYVLSGCGRITDANRACVGSSLHRCSVIRDGSSDEVVGLTLRVARVVEGIAATIEDILASKKSVLLIGAPGRGKTTLLRDIAQLMASSEHDRRVMIVDTNNEIAGEGVLPHIAIGRARRMKVGTRNRQYRVMLEAVQNHTPEILVIDEIGTSQEAHEAIAIRQRGVQLIATTHGETIADVIRNPNLRVLMGGVNAVILSAQEKELQGANSKTRLERKTPPAFDVCIELLSMTKWRVHYDVVKAVDAVLRGMDEVVVCELRELVDGEIRISRGLYPDKADVNKPINASASESGISN